MKFPACLLSLCLFFTACDESDERHGFVTPSGVANEGDGVKTITIDLGRAVTSGTTISYIVFGSAFLNGDYELLTPSSISSSTFVMQVKGGESTATLSIGLIDDVHIEEENETIYIQLIGSSDVNLNGSLKNVQYVLEVEDNDTVPSEGLQIDLSWHTGEGVSINTANFDLFLARNVEFDSEGLVTNFELLDNPRSTNPDGFESYIMAPDIPDDEYYVVINFVEGTSNAEVYLHMSTSIEQGTASGQVNTAQVGKNVYYGPITKNGNSFIFHQ